MPFYGVVDASDVDPTDPSSFPFVSEAEYEELLIECQILRRYLVAALDACEFACDEGFQWPCDPFGDEALAFVDPNTALGRIALVIEAASAGETTQIGSTEGESTARKGNAHD